MVVAYWTGCRRGNRRGLGLMDKIVVHGGKGTTAEVIVSGSKNAALPVRPLALPY